MQHQYTDWGTDAFKAVLVMHCLLCPCDIAGIEARHASVRRQLVGKSIQVKRMSFEVLGANWLFQQWRRWKAQNLKCQLKPQCLFFEKATPSTKRRSVKKRRGAGGAWRVFLARVASGKKGCWQSSNSSRQNSWCDAGQAQALTEEGAMPCTEILLHEDQGVVNYWQAWGSYQICKGGSQEH
eukprot:5567435-Amphidinium_carterae.1